MIYCTVGQLDAKSEDSKLKENVRTSKSWLLYLLTNPIVERHAY